MSVPAELLVVDEEAEELSAEEIEPISIALRALIKKVEAAEQKDQIKLSGSNY